MVKSTILSSLEGYIFIFNGLFSIKNKILNSGLRIGGGGGMAPHLYAPRVADDGQH